MSKIRRSACSTYVMVSKRIFQSCHRVQNLAAILSFRPLQLFKRRIMLSNGCVVVNVLISLVIFIFSLFQLH